jgi:hypothetical protein
MACKRLPELLAYEREKYQEQIRQKKEYFDELTGYDVWEYLVERYFQKYCFQEWARKEKEYFCSTCSERKDCYVNN